MLRDKLLLLKSFRNHRSRSTLPFSSSEIQAGYNDRPIFIHAGTHGPAVITLHHEIDRQTQLPPSMAGVRLAEAASHNLGVIGDNGDVIPPTHELPRLSLSTVGLLRENLHHVLLGIRGRIVGAVAVLRNVQRLLAAVEEFQHIAGRGRVDDRGGNDLVHGLVVGRFGRVVDETGAAAVDGAGEESHAQGFLVGNGLERADQIGALEILAPRASQYWSHWEKMDGEMEIGPDL